ncbi:hypothetical protein LOC54_09760 [Acetobacter sp. AN02]|uniref:hypothetical protein n=1 Tax=Acetobacter sp. AN02 TaxID=2894186 RepID=UPI00243467D3|nr:hypothetical protein [Acetobacter sp. AN02]MDG6095384.1 hypothetical protein [Acetobacter sp. AN02]
MLHSSSDPLQPVSDCPACPRLAEYRVSGRLAAPDEWNAPLLPSGDVSAGLLIVAPPCEHAKHRTTAEALIGMLPFFGDVLAETGFSDTASPSLLLKDCRLVSAVRCAVPAGLALPTEVSGCNRFLIPTVIPTEFSCDSSVM